MELNYTLKKNILKIYIKSDTPKKRMVTGVFDIPFHKDFEISCDKPDASIKKIHDYRTGNTHLFIDLGVLGKGETVVTAEISGNPQKPVNPEYIKDGFAAMYFGNHAYLRSCDKEAAIKVELNAPDNAYLRLISGNRIYSKNGKLSFTVNSDWENESSILYNFPENIFAKEIKKARVKVIGKTTCSRWSGQ